MRSVVKSFDKPTKLDAPVSQSMAFVKSDSCRSEGAYSLRPRVSQPSIAILHCGSVAMLKARHSIFVKQFYKSHITKAI